MAVFLFTDIEGSTKKWEKYPELMKDILAKHDAIIRTNVEDYGGKIIKHTGDGFFVVFNNGQPLESALMIQKKLAGESWGELDELRVRIGLHAGHADQRGGDFFGPAINRTARVMSAAWGGQIIMTPAVKNSAEIPKGAVLRDLGIHLLKDLSEPQNIYQLQHPDLPLSDFPPLRSLSAQPHNLPIQSTPFLGREKELGEISKLLKDPSCRLLTLIGTGGIGKTRLALQAAAENIENFAHGVYFIALEPLTSVDFLISTIAKALKFSLYTKKDQKNQLLDYLREKEILLILDNFEHLIEGASIIAEILGTASKIKILVTSRELLNLRGEWILQIKGMDIPEGERIDVEGYSAVQLFFYNARRVNSGVAFTDEDRLYVVRISQLVGGLPLGIELASAWLRTLSCKEIAQEIEKSIDFLVTTLRDIPERHRSLKAVFEYSWKLLSDNEKDSLKKISVFHGGFSRQAAETVVGVNLAVLSGLVDKSLLRRNASGRYEMLEVLRQYALQKMIEVEESLVEQEHAAYFSNLLEERKDKIVDIEEERALSEISEEIRNIKAAWRYAVEHGNLDITEKMMVAFFAFFEIQGWYIEAKREIESCLDMIQTQNKDYKKDLLYNRAISRYGSIFYRLGNFKQAQEHLMSSLAVFREFEVERDIQYSLNCLGNINNVLGHYSDAEKYYEECLEISKAMNMKKGLLGAYNNLGVIYYNQKQYDKAREYFEESLKISERLNYEQGIAMAHANKGLIAHALGNYDEAKELMLKSLEIDKRSGIKIHLANSLHNLGLIYKSAGDHTGAENYYKESLALRREIGDRLGVAVSLNNLGNLFQDTGRYAESIGYHLESLALRREIGDELGQAMSLLNIAGSYVDNGDLNKAKDYFLDCLKLNEKLKDKATLLQSLLQISEYIILRGDKELGLEILTLLDRHKTDDKEFLSETGSALIKLKTQVSNELIKTVKQRAESMTLEHMNTKIMTYLQKDAVLEK
jgi:predicted ATPase/class 3 adenylate cyclase/Tfp pilus assembly protein PilF